MRPGTGGRQLRATAFTPTTATAAYRERFGDPDEVISKGGATLFVWWIDREGDGALDARLSSRDLQGGETVLGQIHPLLEQTTNQGLRPALILCVVNLSGAARYEERLDLQYLQDQIYNKRIRWVAWRDEDRMAREELPFFTFIDLLKRTDTKLYLERIGRFVEWSNDRFQLNLQNTSAVEERERIYNRTHRALHTRWVGEGRGWPSSGVFGFRRNKLTRFLEVDPEQFEFVRRAFYEYIDLAGEGGGTRTLLKNLADAGCEFSRSKLSLLLKDEIYVTGEYTINRRGQRVACEPIPLGDWAIPADVFQRVQELILIRRGKETRNPPGTFPLNTLVRHECGMTLRSRMQRSGKRSSLLHDDAGCKGSYFATEIIEARVCSELLRLASCEELQAAWAAAKPLEPTEAAAVLDDAQRKDLRRRIRRLEERQTQLHRNYMDRLVNTDEPADENAYWALIGGIQEEIDQAAHRLERAEALDQVRKTVNERAERSDDLLAELRDILTPELPADLAHRARRAALIRKMVSKIVIYGDAKNAEIEIHGPLIPKDLPRLPVFDPVAHAMNDLDANVQALSAKSDDETPTGHQVKPYETVRVEPLGPMGVNCSKPPPLRIVRIPAWRSPRLPLGDARMPTKSEFPRESLERVVELLVDGKTQRQCALAMTAEKRPKRCAGGWESSTVRTALRDAKATLNLDDETLRLLEQSEERTRNYHWRRRRRLDLEMAGLSPEAVDV